MTGFRSRDFQAPCRTRPRLPCHGPIAGRVSDEVIPLDTSQQSSACKIGTGIVLLIAGKIKGDSLVGLFFVDWYASRESVGYAVPKADIRLSNHPAEIYFLAIGTDMRKID